MLLRDGQLGHRPRPGQVAARELAAPHLYRERIGALFSPFPLFGEQHAGRDVEQGRDLPEVPVAGQAERGGMGPLDQVLVLVGRKHAARHHEREPGTGPREHLHTVRQEHRR